MLIVDDSRLNLLKMKEKLLKLSVGDKDEILKDYKELAMSIDREEYEALLEKIRKNDYTKLPLEDQIAFLDEIESNYNSLNELEWGYKSIYDEYASDELELSDISIILVDNVRNRRSAIEGYLMNKKNLENNKIELDRLNSELIRLTKKQSVVNDRIKSISDSLKVELLRVEGRVFGPNNELVYTSIVKEFDDVGLNLTPLVDNFNLLEKELSKAYQDKKDSEEMVEAAQICYEDSTKNRAVYSDIKEDAKENEYRLILLEIVHEICSDTPEYDLMVNKLYRVLNLIEERKYYLNNKYYIDPFARLKIEEYVDELNSLGNNEEEIDNVKKTITYMISSISNMEELNDEFVDKINEHLTIIEGDEFENVMIVDDYVSEKDSSTKVVKIDEVPEEFMLARATEKADNVINRVNKLFNGDTVSEANLVTPDLIIDSVKEEDNNNENSNIDIFTEMTNEVPVEEESSEEIFTSEPEVFDEVVPVENNISVDTTNVFVEETPFEEKTANTNSDLFEETQPFEEVALFSDRYDEEVFGPTQDKAPEVLPSEQVVVPEALEESPLPVLEPGQPKEEVKSEESMPDIFWTTQEKEELTKVDSYEDNKVSFDDQIEALIGTDNVSNTRKR